MPCEGALSRRIVRQGCRKTACIRLGLESQSQTLKIPISTVPASGPRGHLRRKAMMRPPANRSASQRGRFRCERRRAKVHPVQDDQQLQLPPVFHAVRLEVVAPHAVAARCAVPDAAVFAVPGQPAAFSLLPGHLQVFLLPQPVHPLQGDPPTRPHPHLVHPLAAAGADRLPPADAVPRPDAGPRPDASADTAVCCAAGPRPGTPAAPKPGAPPESATPDAASRRASELF